MASNWLAVPVVEMSWLPGTMLYGMSAFSNVDIACEARVHSAATASMFCTTSPSWVTNCVLYCARVSTSHCVWARYCAKRVFGMFSE